MNFHVLGCEVIESFILSFGTEKENLIRVVLMYPLYSVLGGERKKTVLFKMVSEILY